MSSTNREFCIGIACHDLGVDIQRRGAMGATARETSRHGGMVVRGSVRIPDND